MIKKKGSITDVLIDSVDKFSKASAKKVCLDYYKKLQDP